MLIGEGKSIAWYIGSLRRPIAMSGCCANHLETDVVAERGVPRMKRLGVGWFIGGSKRPVGATYLTIQTAKPP